MRALRRAGAAAALLGIPAWTVGGAPLAAADPARAAAALPGPASLALVGAALAGLGLWRRWRIPVQPASQSGTGRPSAG